MKPRYKWQPLRRSTALPISEQLFADHARLSGWSREQTHAALNAEDAAVTIWVNDTYQVARRELGDKRIHLNIRRRDGAAIMRDWRHFQTIKNELIGEECEAVELYPAESRVSDESNKYHLIGCTDPAFRFPFGELFGGTRNVSYESGKSPGTRQRPL